MRKEYHPDILCFQDQTFEVALSLSETLLCRLKSKIGRRTLEFELSERKPLERARSACFSRHVDKRDREGGRDRGRWHQYNMSCGVLHTQVAGRGRVTATAAGSIVTLIDVIAGGKVT